MAKTYRRHLAPGEASKRGPARKRRGSLKTAKQQRVNARVALRREAL